jgi:hypothetical protein
MTEPAQPAPRRSRRTPDIAAADPVAADPGQAAVAPALPAVVETRSGADIPSVATGSLRVERGGIGEATADSVEVRMGGIGRVDAEDVYVAWGGIGAGRATTMSVEMGSVGAAMTGELRVTQGMVTSVVAREATVEQALVRTLIAGHVTIARPSAVLVMIAARVDGDVRPVIDWKGALAAGLAFGLVGAFVRALRGR